MKMVRFQIFDGGHAEYPRPEAEGTLVEFALSVPLFMQLGFIPPLSVLNEIAKQGQRAGLTTVGFLTRWKPFTVTEAEYEEFVAALLAVDFVVDPEVNAAKSLNDWIGKVGKKYWAEHPRSGDE